METTRGNREPVPGFTRAAEIERFGTAIENALKIGRAYPDFLANGCSR